MELRFKKGILEKLSSLFAEGEETAFLFAQTNAYRKRLNLIRQQMMG